MYSYEQKKYERRLKVSIKIAVFGDLLELTVDTD